MSGGENAEPEDAIKLQMHPMPERPPDYSSHLAPGPPLPAAPHFLGPPGMSAVGYYSPPQPGTLYHPVGSTHPIQYQPGRNPLQTQPAPVMWMPAPAPVPNCPPGLEYLAQLDSIHVLQHFQLLQVISTVQLNNVYDVKNGVGQMVYVVTEHTDDFTRHAYRSLRPFVLRVTDGTGREVMAMQRPFRCSCCCCCCHWARQELEVQSPPGCTIGFVVEHWNPCRAVYSIQNEKREAVLRVRGPCATYGCGSDSVFEVQSPDGTSTVGSIVRRWNGLLSAMGQADQFDIHFPLDLDVKMKAMVFGACFLIDFMYFERSPQHQSSL